MNSEKVNLSEKLSRFSDYWNPKIVSELNDSYVKLVKVKGEFVWHHPTVKTSYSWWRRVTS
jgi:hypothetical protein